MQLLRYGNPESRRAQSSPTRSTPFSMCSQRYSLPEPTFSFSTAKSHKEEPEFDIPKLVWERKDAMATQKRVEEAQARSKPKKAADPGAMIISSYKTLIDDSIFADLSPFADDLTTSDHEKSDSEKEWDALVQDITNGKDWFFQTHGFLDWILGVNDQLIPELYSLKDDRILSSKFGEGFEELEDSKGFNSKNLDLGLVDSSLFACFET
ncbi:hypothetical protein H5410_002946 [Solanum commersonii]|uniref:Uncharacterized protein n=1 Tax=Solanum commersonii TaxID=4109 RepID=A0A9J6B396_SOLCO|nr:hypothetical protein H5410_002946 [Solanum commersonii]